MNQSTYISIKIGAGIICIILGIVSAIIFKNFIMALSGIVMGISCLWRATAIKNDKNQTYPAILFLIGIAIQTTYSLLHSKN